MSELWSYALPADDVDDEDVMPATVEGKEMAIYRVEDEYFATDNLCTHGAAKLSEGIVIGDYIECPLHQGLFCVRDGKAMGDLVTEDVKSYPTKVEDGKVFVQLAL
ncbi:MAG: naphthalene 1,2-dioxygenase system ferredoxin subunit [Saprospiraceae bacterium]|jgi:naphthalene 1,2-dioxygenase system ferredoxin subunit